MKSKLGRVLAILLALTFVLGLLPARVEKPVTAASGLANGTVIYYEDFNYPDNSTKSKVLSTLGWKTATTLRSNQTNYSIVGGRLYCDSITPAATGDSYVTVLDDAAMSEVAKGDYTISYKLTYASAANYTRYGCLIYNYNGYKSYNSVHLRIAGYGNNQVRSAAKWYDYDGGTLKATGTSSLSYKLFGTQCLTANASSNTGYPFVNKTLTVRIAVDIDAGPTVYVNGTKVSSPTSTYKTMMTASAEYAKAIGIKTSKEVQLYIDDIMVYTGLGAIPTGVTKESVTYQRPVSTADKNAIKVMTFNTLFSDQSTDVFGNGITRTYHMYNVVAGLHPDIVGMQERNATNKSGITSLLQSDADYALVHEYRTDTSVANVLSYVPILYNTKRFTLVENSAANNNAAHGALLFNKSYNIKDMTASQIAAYAGTKGLAWAVLKDKKTGSYVLALNAHFALNTSDYTGYTDEEAIEARLSNASQALEKMQAVYDVYGVIPTVFTGDFNMRYYDPAYKLLSKTFESSIYASDDFIKYEYSMNKVTGATFTRAPNAPIDHIFYNDEALTPTSYYVGNKAAELMIASDHLPVMTTFSYNKVAEPTPSHTTGVYATTQFVTLAGDGEIYYTTDNSDPRTSKTRKLYGEAISVSEDTVIKSTAKVGGVYSDVNRVTLFFGTPLVISEVIKNAPGTDFTEGFEIVNVSSVDVDLSDFTVWSYSNAVESTAISVADAEVDSQMPMAYKEGDAIVPSGAIAFCPIVMGDTYLNKDALSSSESAYLVTVNEDATKVTYHTDRWAKAIAYDKSGNIPASLIFPIDRTARSIGYTDSGTVVRRLDYYNSTDGATNSLSKSFSMANSNYTRLYITLFYEQSVANAVCVVNLDSTDGGITTATDGTTSVATGAFNFTPTATKTMTTQSFTSNKYSIGSLTAEQESVFDSYLSARRKENATAIRTATEFAAMSSSGNYYLAADITLTASYAGVFTGSLDGRGHTVTTSVPMFTEMGATVKNLIVNGNINGNGGYNGAVAAQASGTARFENITVNASLSGGTSTGGIFGYAGSGADISVVRCINNGNISGTAQTGGMIGYCQGTRLAIDECINNGKIYSTSYAGGIICRFGKNAATMSYKCNITNCVNNGEVSSTATRAAGILGYSVGYIMISGCTNYGYIHYEGTVAEFNAGGIYGEGGNTYTSGTTTVETKNSHIIRDCYNYGNVEGTCSAGGIVGKTAYVAPVSGYNYIIESCGNAGNISCKDGGANRTTKGAGGIVGYFYGAANNVLSRCYNVGNVSVVANANGSSVRAGGIASYLNGTKLYLEDCYNAGTISASGTGSSKYQLYFNNNATGAASGYINNNHALSVSGATYESNGTQASSVTTFTAAELTDGTLRDRINTGAGQTYYFQHTTEKYPVLREYKGFTLWDIILKDDSDYSAGDTQIFKVNTLTDVPNFKAEFVTEVKVYRGDTEVSVNDYIGTGYTVRSFDGKVVKVIAVTGDLDGNGNLGALDYIAIKQYLKKEMLFSDIQCVAGDLDDSGDLSSLDYIAMKQRIKN